MLLSIKSHFPLLFLGLILGCSLCSLMIFLLPPKHLRVLGLLVLLPGPALAFLLPDLHKAHIYWVSHHYALLQGLLISPTVMFPLGATLLRIPPATVRTATSLGANFYVRLQLIWAPLLLPGIMLSFILAFIFSSLCIILDYI